MLGTTTNWVRQTTKRTQVVEKKTETSCSLIYVDFFLIYFFCPVSDMITHQDSEQRPSRKYQCIFLMC